MRKRGGVALDVVSVQPFQRARDRAVQPHLSGDREFAEQRLLHQRVGEAVLAGHPRLRDHPRLQRLLHQQQQRLVVMAGEVREEVVAKLATGDGGKRDQIVAVLR